MVVERRRQPDTPTRWPNYAGESVTLTRWRQRGGGSAADSYFGECERALEAAGDAPAEQLEALVSATVRFRTGHAVKSRIVLTEGRSLEPEYLARHRENEERGSGQFRRVIERGVTEGVFLTPYPDDARRAIIAMCNAIAQWYRPDGPVGVDELVERYVSLALTIVEYRPRGARRPVRG